MIIGAPLSDLITIEGANIWDKLFLNWRLFVLDTPFFCTISNFSNIIWLVSLWISFHSKVIFYIYFPHPKHFKHIKRIHWYRASMLIFAVSQYMGSYFTLPFIYISFANMAAILTQSDFWSSLVENFFW